MFVDLQYSVYCCSLSKKITWYDTLSSFICILYMTCLRKSTKSTRNKIQQKINNLQQFNFKLLFLKKNFVVNN